MEEITVLRSNFIIDSENVMPALEAIKNKYPEIIDQLTQPTIQHQFQFALYLLGYHTRIHNDGMMFGLSKIALPGIVPSEIRYQEFFDLLSSYTQPGSYVELVVNGVEKTITLKDEHVLNNQMDVPSSKEEEIEQVIIKEIDETVAAEIAKEIVPEVIRKEEKTMSEIVEEAIKKAEETTVKKKPRKPRVKKEVQK